MLLDNIFSSIAHMPTIYSLFLFVLMMQNQSFQYDPAQQRHTAALSYKVQNLSKQLSFKHIVGFYSLFIGVPAIGSYILYSLNVSAFDLLPITIFLGHINYRFEQFNHTQNSLSLFQGGTSREQKIRTGEITLEQRMKERIVDGYQNGSCVFSIRSLNRFRDPISLSHNFPFCK